MAGDSAAVADQDEAVQLVNLALCRLNKGEDGGRSNPLTFRHSVRQGIFSYSEHRHTSAQSDYTMSG